MLVIFVYALLVSPHQGRQPGAAAGRMRVAAPQVHEQQVQAGVQGRRGVQSRRGVRGVGVLVLAFQQLPDGGQDGAGFAQGQPGRQLVQGHGSRVPPEFLLYHEHVAVGYVAQILVVALVKSLVQRLIGELVNCHILHENKYSQYILTSENLHSAHSGGHLRSEVQLSRHASRVNCTLIAEQAF